MIRSLVERLPFMITPRWVGVMAQPIAIDDMLEYLAGRASFYPSPNPACLRSVARTRYATRISCVRIAKQRGLRLRMLSVPVLTP